MGGEPRRALAGVRILDLSQVAIGPYCTLLLAGLGAEVVKVESHRRADTSRAAVAPATATQMQQYPDGKPGPRPWNETAYFNQRNRGKLGITIDFATDAGRALVLRLAAVSDALVENFRASVLERQGLGWAALHAANPRLVYLKLSSQGASGPERDYGSLGSTLEQTAGLASVTGYDDGHPLLTNETYPDPVGAMLAVGALIAGLRRARASGEGEFIDLSQREMTLGLIAEPLMDYALNSRVAGPIGNADPEMAPHGVYPCAGEDSWIAIAVETDEQWQALRREMGDPEWSRDPALETVSGRLARRALLDGQIGEWTRPHEQRALTERLQAAGVPAGGVLDGQQLIADPHLNARGFWEPVAPVEVGRPFPMVTPPWRMSGSPYRPLHPAPPLGADNDRVFRDLLGLSEAEYAALRESEVICTDARW